MDMTDLEDVARRYKDATDALDAVRAEMQTTAVAISQQPGVKQADVVRITGWSREHLRRLREKAEAERQRVEMEALRKKVEELSAPASAPPEKARPAVAAPRQQVTQAVPEPAADNAFDMTTKEIRHLIRLASARATGQQPELLHRAAATAKSLGHDPDEKVLDTAYEMGLLTDADVVAVREQIAAAQPGPAADTTEEN